MVRIDPTLRLAAFASAIAAGLLAPGSAPIRAAEANAQEAWDAIYIGGNKVGHNHIQVAPVQDGRGRPLVRVQVNTVQVFNRQDDRVSMEFRYGTIETRDGQVLRLDTRARTGRDELRTHGDVVDGRMTLVLEGGGQERRVAIPWGADVRGPYAAEMSLSREPLAPGETRELKMFVPVLNQICTTRLVASDKESVILGGGVTRDLLRVQQTTLDPTGKHLAELDTVFWVDDGGQIMKSHVDLLGGMDVYRTTRDAALAPNGEFDLLRATIVKVTHKIAESDRRRNIIYRFTLANGDPSEIFPSDRRQTVRRGATGTATIDVRAAGPDDGRPEGGAVADEFLRPNPLVNSDDPKVRELARRAVGNRTDPWEKARAIEDWVHENLKQKNFSNAFASAAEVARDLEGDCTEHGVLTAAMCRAQGVPSRCVIGLVYAEPLGGFGPHMWNEVFVNGRWVAIDSAFDQSDVDATHIKISTTSLDGVAPFDAFMPVLRIASGLKIEPLEIR